jgi:hypothetical protein
VNILVSVDMHKDETSSNQQWFFKALGQNSLLPVVGFKKYHRYAYLHGIGRLVFSDTGEGSAL